jgi:hypothetical protein
MLDVSGFGVVPLMVSFNYHIHAIALILSFAQDILTAFSILLDYPTLPERIRNAMDIFSQGETSCNKKDCVWLLQLLNKSCYFCGDRCLQESQVCDLVDSLFTLAGSIDKVIPYDDVLELLLHHPILEMFISLQFQNQAKRDPSDD